MTFYFNEEEAETKTRLISRTVVRMVSQLCGDQPMFHNCQFHEKFLSSNKTIPFERYQLFSTFLTGFKTIFKWSTNF